MAAKPICLYLQKSDLDLLDALVEDAKSKSFTPGKVNRTTIISELLLERSIKLKGGA